MQQNPVECLLQAVEQEREGTLGDFAEKPWLPWVRNVSVSWSGIFSLFESSSEWKPLWAL